VKNDCKLSVGIISEGAEDPDNGRYRKNVAWLKHWRSHPLIEFWNHGHSHTKTTYCCSSLEDQIADLKRNEDGVTPVFGQGLKIFGAPFNSVDEQTVHACLAAGIEIMFYAPDPSPDGLLNIPAAWFFSGPEMITGKKSRVPNVVRIRRALSAHFLKHPIGVVQLHPLACDDQGFSEFESLISYLKFLGHPTVTAASFFQQRKPSRGIVA
jgi:peptidoglycan/xylan/chitin deacetylase (PgdA/CDA1 family)